MIHNYYGYQFTSCHPSVFSHQPGFPPPDCFLVPPPFTTVPPVFFLGAGPRLIVIFIADPCLALVPAGKSCVTTRPLSTFASYWLSLDTSKPSPVKVLSASASDFPATSGTSTPGAGPALTVKLIVEPLLIDSDSAISCPIISLSLHRYKFLPEPTSKTSFFQFSLYETEIANDDDLVLFLSKKLEWKGEN